MPEHDDAVVSVPERHRIEECLGIVILELQRPGDAGVGRLVDARSRAIADSKNIGGLRVGRVDVSKVELVGGHCKLLPGCATVKRAQHGAFRSAGPGDAIAHCAHTAQACGYAAFLDCPMCRRQEKGRGNEE